MENLLLVIFVSVIAGQLVRGSDPQPPVCRLGQRYNAPVVNDCTAYWQCDNGEGTKKYCPRFFFGAFQEKFDSVKLECIEDYPLHRAVCYKAPPPTPTPSSDPPPSPTPSAGSSTMSSTSSPSTASSTSSPSTVTNPSSSTVTTPKHGGGASSIAPLGWLLVALLAAAPTFVSR